MADIRSDSKALVELVRFLDREEFELDGMSADRRAHRYKHRSLHPAPLIDVLAPDNVGPRADLTTTPPGRTVEVPGGTQALHRREMVQVRLARVGKLADPIHPSWALVGNRYRDDGLAALQILLEEP
jgi:hypothetical protein